MIEKFGAKNINVHQQDFLSTDPFDSRWANVNAFLIDPTCSGSGIEKPRPERTLREEDHQKIESLSNFQVSIVSHAMKFPSVKRIVYSTCSIHSQENEQVVQKLLESHPNFKLDMALPEWHRRGLEPFSYTLRASSTQDRMHGFFVALFVKNE
jgi:putative methyltransferase